MTEELPNSLFHYTSYPGLEGILKSKEIWCTKIQHLNDSRELAHAVDLLHGVLRTDIGDYLRGITVDDLHKEAEKASIFVASFCDEGDLLSQWRGYAGSSGAALSFDFESLKTAALNNGFMLEKCIYDPRDQRAFLKNPLISNLSPEGRLDFTCPDRRTKFVKEFLIFASRYKHPGFKEETEWRLIKWLDDIPEAEVCVRVFPAGLKPYIALDISRNEHENPQNTCIKSVKIGPHSHQQLQIESVMLLARQHKVIFSEDPTTSVIPYRQL